MHNWKEAISYKRFGHDNSSLGHISRSEFIRDYDRIIFLPAFRRLQNKTQVFPLPGNVFVHNRLTHSLEVASVGRSLGSMAGQVLIEKYGTSWDQDTFDFYKFDLQGVVSAACLAHDLGNPAFGHSGEKAISTYFINNEHIFRPSAQRDQYLNDKEWCDLIAFEGNANALRLLTKDFQGRLPGGYRMMMVTLASIIKYPCAAFQTNKNHLNTKKYGFFQSDFKAFSEVMSCFGLYDAHSPRRHPFVYLVEAADDICYLIMDMEDAHRIHILGREALESAFLKIIAPLKSKEFLQNTKETLLKLNDDNEAIAYLRAKAISVLLDACIDVFRQDESSFLGGRHDKSIMEYVKNMCPALDEIHAISVKKIYNQRSVIEVEMVGYTVMETLLDVFIGAILPTASSPLQSKLMSLIPQQFKTFHDNDTIYEKIMCILDYISGMTDGYATELYRKIKGIEWPSHRGY